MKKAKAILQVLQGLGALTATDRQGSLAKFLLLLASRHPEPVLLKECEAALHLTQGQVSRLARSLHSINAEGRLGLNLIEIDFDLYAPRTKLLRLNKRGEAALKDILTGRSLKDI